MSGLDYVFKLVTYNINVHNPNKRTRKLLKLKKEKDQVVYLQATHVDQKEHSKLTRNGFKYKFSSSHPSGRKRGVAILISNKLRYDHQTEIKDKEGRYILIKGQLHFLMFMSPQVANLSFIKKSLI